MRLNKKSFYPILLLLVAVNVPFTARAVYLDRLCYRLLLKPVFDRMPPINPTANSLRIKLARDPGAQFNYSEQKAYENLSDRERETVDAFRNGPKNSPWLRSILDPYTVVSSFSRFRLKPKLLSIYRTFLVSLFLAGLTPQVIPMESYPDFNSYPPLQSNEFELVLATMHTYIKIGSHTYDYMITEARKDSVNHYEQRTTKRIRFQVTNSEVAQLKEFLESEVGSRGLYYVYPGLGTNCLSNVLRAVSMSTSIVVPDGVNRSPALTEGYFRIRQALNDTRIVSVAKFNTKGDASSEIPYAVINVFDSFLATIFFVDHVIAAQWDRTPWGWGIKLSNGPQGKIEK